MGASYPPKKYLSVVLLVGGVMIFMAFQPSSKADSGAPLVEWNMDTAYGLGLLFAGLTYVPRLSHTHTLTHTHSLSLIYIYININIYV